MDLFTPAEAAASYASVSVKKASMPLGKAVLLSVLAGVLIAVPGAVTNMTSYALTNNSIIRLLSGLLFAFGLGMVILSGSELFTGNTLMSIGVMEHRVKLPEMLRSWLIVFLGNFAGSLLVAFICARFGWADAGGGLLGAFSVKMALGKMTMPFANGVMMGILCNVLVTLGVLFSLSAKDVAGRIMGAYVPVALFVICGFNHCIADMFYCAMGLFCKGAYGGLAAAEYGIDLAGLTWGQYFLGNMLPVTLGNIIGGVLVGFIFWYCYLRGSQK